MGRKIAIICIFLFIASVVFFIFAAYESKKDERIIEYVKDKYNLDVVVSKRSNIDEGNMGHTWHTVQVKDNKNIQFRVEVDGLIFSNIIGDEYNYGLQTFEHYKKFKPLLKEMQTIGFEPAKKENVLQYKIDYISYDDQEPISELLLTLKSISKLDFNQFEGAVRDRLFALITLVQQSDLPITKIELLDNQSQSTDFRFTHIQEITSKEKLLEIMKNESKDYWTFLFRNQLEDKLKALENQHLECKDISVTEVKNAKPYLYNVTILFKDDMMQYTKNPKMIDEIYQISTLLQTELPDEFFNLKLLNSGKYEVERNYPLTTIQTREQIESIVQNELQELPFK
ncbi:hypothetical protein ACT1UG_29220 [Bacillus paramycoides]|uniref:hypothetical protein n=1 Tax=Bacillus paramycoides TaxID=2026194 RepID=UPI004059A830